MGGGVEVIPGIAAVQADHVPPVVGGADLVGQPGDRQVGQAQPVEEQPGQGVKAVAVAPVVGQHQVGRLHIVAFVEMGDIVAVALDPVIDGVDLLLGGHVIGEDLRQKLVGLLLDEGLVHIGLRGLHHGDGGLDGGLIACAVGGVVDQLIAARGAEIHPLAVHGELGVGIGVVGDQDAAAVGHAAAHEDGQLIHAHDLRSGGIGGDLRLGGRFGGNGIGDRVGLHVGDGGGGGGLGLADMVADQVADACGNQDHHGQEGQNKNLEAPALSGPLAGTGSASALVGLDGTAVGGGAGSGLPGASGGSGLIHHVCSSAE